MKKSHLLTAAACMTASLAFFGCPSQAADPGNNSVTPVGPTVTVTTLSSVFSQSKDAVESDAANIKDDLVSGVTEYQVNDAAGLLKLADLVNGGETLEGYTITQTADIALNAAVLDKDFEPISGLNLTVFDGIGQKGLPFSGTYDGNGYTVSGVYITDARQGLGFFGCVSGATIVNVNIVDALVVNANESGAEDGSDDDRFGGVVGLVTGSSTITDVLFVGTVGSEEALANGGTVEYVGGIAGRVDVASEMTRCVAVTKIYANAAYDALNNKGADKVTFTDCYGFNVEKLDSVQTGNGTSETVENAYAAVSGNENLAAFIAGIYEIDPSSGSDDEDPVVNPDPEDEGPTVNPDPEDEGPTVNPDPKQPVEENPSTEGGEGGETSEESAEVN